MGPLQSIFRPHCSDGPTRAHRGRFIDHLAVIGPSAGALLAPLPAYCIAAGERRRAAFHVAGALDTANRKRMAGAPDFLGKSPDRNQAEPSAPNQAASPVPDQAEALTASSSLSSSRTETSLDTPPSSMVTPYRTSAASIVSLRWVTTMNWVSSENSRK